MKIEINNCIECNSHQVLPDPDPYDWFCDDDVKVVCNAVKTKDGNQIITSACRPYNIEKECCIPDWCPKKLIKGEITMKTSEFINQLIEKWKTLNDTERKSVANKLNIPNFYELMNSIISD